MRSWETCYCWDFSHFKLTFQEIFLDWPDCLMHLSFLQTAQQSSPGLWQHSSPSKPSSHHVHKALLFISTSLGLDTWQEFTIIIVCQPQCSAQFFPLGGCKWLHITLQLTEFGFVGCNFRTTQVKFSLAIIAILKIMSLLMLWVEDGKLCDIPGRAYAISY